MRIDLRPFNDTFTSAAVTLRRMISGDDRVQCTSKHKGGSGRDLFEGRPANATFAGGTNKNHKNTRSE
jgi:hypothetical protein